MKNKYRTIPLLGLCVMLFPLFGYAQNSALDKALDRAVAAQTASVHVWVRLAKPVYISDVMFRRPRGKNIVIRTDYKEKQCLGRLSAQEKQVYVPLACVAEDKYRADEMRITFANKQTVQKSANDLQFTKTAAYIKL